MALYICFPSKPELRNTSVNSCIVDAASGPAAITAAVADIANTAAPGGIQHVADWSAVLVSDLSGLVWFQGPPVNGGLSGADRFRGQ